MANQFQFSTEQMRVALTETRGMIAYAADRLGCDYTTIHRRIKKSAVLRRVIQRFRAKRIDLAESKLDELLFAGDYRAIEFTLRTIGKKRGYVERTETKLSGSVEIPIVITTIEVEVPKRDST